MIDIRSEIIMASAGSGKTYQLTDRFIKLLAAGVAPDEVVALTFTRKAAGEFLDAILEKLARAASDKAFADELSKRLGIPDGGPGPEGFLALLRGLVAQVHRLNLGTLDSFFVRLVQGLPMELGLGGEFEMLPDEAAVRRARRDVYDDVFRGAGVKDESRAAFLTALIEASYGHDELGMVAVLDRFVGAHHGTLLAVPDGARWGRAEAVWPDGCPYLPATMEKFLTSVGRMEAFVFDTEMTDGQTAWWREFFQQARAFLPGAPPPDRMKGILAKLGEHAGQLGREAVTITVSRKGFEFGPPAGEAALAVLHGVLGLELDAKLLRTRGLHAVLDLYERSHDRRLRRRGRVGFDDLAIMLGQRLAAGEGVPTDLAYRLDARLHHWLLDEFQDTSRRQWAVLRELVDEAIQDPEGRRTYFQVGDLKQSIYGWRGGDPTLSLEVRERYSNLGERFLDESFRSGPAVLDTVNRVFGDTDGLANHLPAEAVGRLDFRPHRPSQQTADKAGFATLAYVVPEDSKATDDELFAAVLGIVREADPLARGWSCAVLCQQRATVAAVVDHFRAHGFTAVVNGARAAPATDNAVTSALMALLRAAAFPGDGMAAGHVRLTPLREAAADAGLSWDAVWSEARADIGRSGFEAVVRRWWERLERTGAFDGEGAAFARHRLAALADTARVFDRSGKKSVPEFFAFAEGRAHEEVAGAGVVHVMTVHGAKGLGFDMVVFAELAETNSLKERRDGLGVAPPPSSPAWVLDLPRKAFCELDPVLAKLVAADEAEAAFESLCKLYVAMTRPKRALYLVAKPKAKSTALDYRAVLDDLLGETEEETDFAGAPCTLRYAHGQRRWFEEKPARPATATAAPPPAEPPPVLLGPRRRLAARRPPSRESSWHAPGDPDALAFGRDVHRHFEATGWADDEATGWADDEATGWADEPGAPHGDDGRAAGAVRRCLADPAVRALLSRPAGAGVADLVLWREKGFEAVVGGEWVTGTFDRVQLVRGAGGGFASATVIDFKAGDPAHAGRYAGQAGLYREVVAALTGLDPSEVRAVLVYVSPPTVVEIDP